MLVNLLVIFFLLLIFYQIFLANFNCVEGLKGNTPKPPTPAKKEEVPILTPNKEFIMGQYKKKIEEEKRKMKPKDKN